MLVIVGEDLVCWSDDVEVCPVSSSMQMVTVWVRYKATGDTFLSFFIYASNSATERKELWGELESIGRQVADNPWIIQGDFNVALSPEEHSRFQESRMDMNAIKDFQDMVQNCDMMDLA